MAGPRGRGFAPPDEPEKKKGIDIGATIGLINAIASKDAMSSKDADKDPPANSPRMSGFRNLGGISGRKLG